MKFQDAFVKVLLRIKSNHHPILVVLGGDGQSVQRQSRPFMLKTA
jgi:hypothetical protein